MQFRQFSIAALLFCFSLGCGAPGPSTETDASSPYFVDDASYLYFKNLRVKDYTLEEQPEPRLDLYRHRKQAETLTAPGLRITLVDNWLQDEAYLRIELVDSSGTVSTPVELTPRYERSAQAESYALGAGEREAALRLARELQTALRQRREIAFAVEGVAAETLRIRAADFGPQLTTINDYLRLIDG